MKIKSVPVNTIFVYDNQLHFRLDEDYPFNAVNLATSKPVILMGEMIAQDSIIATWNELHGEIAKVVGNVIS